MPEKGGQWSRGSWRSKLVPAVFTINVLGPRAAFLAPRASGALSARSYIMRCNSRRSLTAFFHQTTSPNHRIRDNAEQRLSWHGHTCPDALARMCTHANHALSVFARVGCAKKRCKSDIRAAGTANAQPGRRTLQYTRTAPQPPPGAATTQAPLAQACCTASCCRKHRLRRCSSTW